MPSFKAIGEATDVYVDALQDTDMAKNINEMVVYEATGQNVEHLITAFQYPGRLEITENTPEQDILRYPVSGIRGVKVLKDVYKISKKFRYQMGIFSVAIHEDGNITEAAHYVSLIADNKCKNIWLWDSAVTDSFKERTETRHIVKTLFPSYTLKGISICEGCKIYQPGAGSDKNVKSYNSQNIFCHTWSLWFLYRMIVAIGSVPEGTISSEVFKINNECKTPRQNLITIKEFAKYFSSEYFDVDFELPDAFDYIWNPQLRKAQKVLGDESIYSRRH